MTYMRTLIKKHVIVTACTKVYQCSLPVASTSKPCTIKLKNLLVVPVICYSANFLLVRSTNACETQLTHNNKDGNYYMQWKRTASARQFCGSDRCPVLLEVNVETKIPDDFLCSFLDLSQIKE